MYVSDWRHSFNIGFNTCFVLIPLGLVVAYILGSWAITFARGKDREFHVYTPNLRAWAAIIGFFADIAVVIVITIKETFYGFVQLLLNTMAADNVAFAADLLAIVCYGVFVVAYFCIARQLFILAKCRKKAKLMRIARSLFRRGRKAVMNDYHPAPVVDFDKYRKAR